MSQARHLAVERDVARKAQVEAKRQADISRAVRDFLQDDLLEQANTHHYLKVQRLDPSLPGRLRPDPTIRQLLDRVSQRFAEGRNDPRLTDDVLAELLQVLGNSYRGIGDYEKGIDFLKRSLALYKQVYAPDDPQTLQCECVLARAILQQGDAKTAVELLEHSAGGLRRQSGASDRATLEAEGSLGWALREAGRTGDAIKLSESILGRWESLPEAPFETLKVLDDLSWAYKDDGRLTEAVRISRRIVPQMQALLGQDHPALLVALHHQAWLLWMDGQAKEALDANLAAWHEAIDMAQKTLAGRISVLTADHPHVLSSRYALSQCLVAGGQQAQAIQELQALVELLQATDFKSSFSLEALRHCGQPDRHQRHRVTTINGGSGIDTLDYRGPFSAPAVLIR